MKNDWREVVRQAIRFRRLPKMTVLTFVDPGLGGTGWAQWLGITHAHPDILGPPTYVGTAHGKVTGGRWLNAVHNITMTVRTVLEQSHVVVMEFPALWASAVSAAAGAKGDLFKLSYLCGALSAQTGAVLVLVSPSDWKGQLPKDVVAQRVRRYWRTLPKMSNHAMDAVGMGLSWAQDWT
jgi:hypothetical protein